MIQTEAQLQQALEQIENLCQAVQSLRTDCSTGIHEISPFLPRALLTKCESSLLTWTNSSLGWKANRSQRSVEEKASDRNCGPIPNFRFDLPPSDSSLPA